MNTILKMLGTQYSLQVRFDNFNNHYVVTVVDEKKMNTSTLRFHVVEAETAIHDILIGTIVLCIDALKRM